jgi:LuxR family transcriptional regulator, maltose regulon positive regulatory protein
VVKARILERLGDHDEAKVNRKEAARLLDATTITGVKASQIDSESLTTGGISSRCAVFGEELSDKEQQILQLMCTKLSRREIGERLYVSLNTVKTHQRVMYRKLGVNDRASAVRRARQLGLI